jgi:predicted DNA-binding transcriptional regulator AlpA
MSEKTPEQLLTPQQVSDMLQISVGTLENWRLKNHGPKYLKLGGQHRSPVRYRLQDVEDFMFEDAKGAGDQK